MRLTHHWLFPNLSNSSDSPEASLKITPDEDAYVPGTVVTLEAKNELGYRFVS